VQAFEILQAAHDKGHIVATGVCDVSTASRLLTFPGLIVQSIGPYGGYSQGGGHTPLGAQHGMGADQVLSLRIVTGDGRFLTASPTENSDLFWAVRGGGGSTFGVVTSMVVKAFPDTKVAVASFDWSMKAQNISAETFFAGLASYLGAFANFTDQGLFAQFNIWPSGFFGDPDPGNHRVNVAPFMGIGKSLAEMKAAAGWWLDEMRGLGINVTVEWQEHATYFPDAYYAFLQRGTGREPANYALTYASRLIPRAALDRSQGRLGRTVAAYRRLLETGHSFNGFQLAPTLARGRPVGSGNAVLPAWRDALSHTIVFQNWPANASAAEQLAARHAFATGPDGAKLLRDATPGSGSYMSEADRLEPEWREAFYGENYPRLLAIKRKYDADDVFYAVTGVGSDGWAVRSADGLPTEDGPLCRV
jgi:FAD/FMN-containing dehydrogenase